MAPAHMLWSPHPHIESSIYVQKGILGSAGCLHVRKDHKQVYCSLSCFG